MIEKSLTLFRQRSELVSLNISIEDLVQQEMQNFIIDQIAHFTKETKKSPSLTIEITESEEIENYELVTEFIQSIAPYHVEIAIDDFGSGYSNFIYILNMGIDFLKIDGTLIKNLLHDEKSQTLVKAIVHFSRELGIKTVAEFVEDEAIFHTIQDFGIDYSQGYYFGAPLPPHKLPSS